MAVQFLPSMSSVIQNEVFSGAGEFVNLLQHGLRLQTQNSEGASSIAVARTLVAPGFGAMMNLVPMDSPHPLYSDTPAYTALRLAFLLDCMVLPTVEPSDPAMKTDQGLVVTNMNGRELAFKRDAAGALTVNGLAVGEERRLSDGTQLYITRGLLFTHDQDVRSAWRRLIDEKAAAGENLCYHGNCGGPVPVPTRPSS